MKHSEVIGDPPETAIVEGNGATGFLSFLIRSLVSMANDPTNKKFFFPEFLQGIKLNNGQKIVPFITTIDLGRVAAMRPPASKFVCDSGWAAFNHYGSGAAAINDPLFSITSGTFNGLNNAKITDYRFDPPTATLAYPVVFTAQLNAYATYANLGINPGSFSFGVTCQSCDKQHEDTLSATGTFQAAFTNPLLTMVVLITLNSDLSVSIDIPVSYTPASGSPIPGIQLTFGSGGNLTVNNIKITDGGQYGPVYGQFANRAFSDPSTTASIIQVFNQTILGDDVRSALASGIQDQFNSLLSALK